MTKWTLQRRKPRAEMDKVRHQHEGSCEPKVEWKESSGERISQQSQCISMEHRRRHGPIWPQFCLLLSRVIATIKLKPCCATERGHTTPLKAGC
eukprot:289750-Pleurochrysis_carterae.AAC.2